VRLKAANRFKVVFLFHYCPFCGKRLTGGGTCPTCGAEPKALVPPPILLPPKSRISRSGIVVLLLLAGGYVEVGLLVGQGFVERPTIQLMSGLSFIFPILVSIAIIWVLLKHK